MSLDWRVVPIERWPGAPTEDRKSHPFRKQGSHGWIQSGVNWSSTVELLERELRQLEAEGILLQMAVTSRDIRNDGWIRANARPEHPGVILTFDSRHGPLSYPCDTFDDWQANARAIALALEALRKVDRYGVSRRGEQYRGWGALPPAGGSTATITAEVAAGVVLGFGGGWSDPDLLEEVLGSWEACRSWIREAEKETHPDTGGKTEDFQRVQQAKAVLQRHHGRPR
jgi:hypothetical protein